MTMRKISLKILLITLTALHQAHPFSSTLSVIGIRSEIDRSENRRITNIHDISIAPPASSSSTALRSGKNTNIDGAISDASSLRETVLSRPSERVPVEDRKQMIEFFTLLNAGRLEEAESVVFGVDGDDSSGVDETVTLLSLTKLMNAWIRKGDLERAYGYFARIAKPDSFAFNSIINGLANSNEAGSSRRAEVILRRFEEMSRTGALDAQPNEETYKPVVHAFLRGNSTGMFEYSINSNIMQTPTLPGNYFSNDFM